MLLIAEAKEIVPARYGFKAVVKHVPDQAFALDEQLYRRLGRRFEAELALWSATENITHGDGRDIHRRCVRHADHRGALPYAGDMAVAAGRRWIRQATR